MPATPHAPRHPVGFRLMSALGIALILAGPGSANGEERLQRGRVPPDELAPYPPRGDPRSRLKDGETPAYVAERDLTPSLRSGEPVVVHSETLTGPDGVVLFRAWPEGAPERGLAIVVDALGYTFGRHGDADLADLARKLGWRREMPLAEDLAKVAIFALKNGTMPVYEASVELQGEDFTLILTCRKLHVRVLFPAKGPVRWMERDTR